MDDMMTDVSTRAVGFPSGARLSNLQIPTTSHAPYARAVRVREGASDRRVEVHWGDDVDTLTRRGFCAPRASSDTHAEPSISSGASPTALLLTRRICTHRVRAGDRARLGMPAMGTYCGIGRTIGRG